MFVLLSKLALLVAAAKILAVKAGPACLVSLPALSACLPCQPACLISLPNLFVLTTSTLFVEVDIL
jgi:hypothetical protein